MATTQSQSKITVMTPSSEQRRSGPLHKWLASEIRNHVREHNLGPGTPLEPEVEIAQRYQVSRGTVRQAMATLVHEGLIDRIAGRGSFIRDHQAEPSNAESKPNWAGITAKTHRIRVLVDCPHQPHPGHIVLTQSIDGLGQFASQTNGSIKLTFEYHGVSHVNDPAAHAFMKQDDCEGMIILPVTQECVQFVNEMGKPDKPTAVLYRRVTNPHVHRFALDNSAGAYQATDYLLRQGHRRIGMLILTWPLAWPSTLKRLDGYRQAMREAGCESPALVAMANDAKNMPEIKPACRQLLGQANPPTAILVNNYNNLRPTLETMAEMNLRVGEDVSLICIDESELAMNHDPQISVVHMPLAHNAIRAMNHLYHAILNDQPPGPEVMTYPELRLRQSCSPIQTLDQLK